MIFFESEGGYFLDIYEQLEKEKQIKQEINRLKKLYKNMSKEKVKLLDGLIKEAAFMKVLLEELRDAVVHNGVTEVFKQGKQEIRVERKESKLYTTYISKYTQVMKQLIDILPPEEKKIEQDKLTEFVNRKKK